MPNFHISKDGVARQCRAATPENCKATPADAKEHFDSREAASKAYETSMRDKEIPGGVKLQKKKNKLPTKPFKSRSKYTNRPAPLPASKNVSAKTVLPANEGKAVIQSTEKVKEPRGYFAKRSHESVNNYRELIISHDRSPNRTLLNPKTPSQMQRLEIDYSDRIEAFEDVLKSMKNDGYFTPESITEIEDLAYNRKVDSGTARLDYFYAHRNDIKRPRFFHTSKKRAAIKKHNLAVLEEEKNSIENFKGLINDFPENYSKELADKHLEKVKEDFPKYAHLVDASSSKNTPIQTFNYKARNPDEAQYFKFMSDEVKTAFNKGDSGALAKELHEKTGYPVNAVGVRNTITGDVSWQHMTVRTPEGRLLDVNGVRPDSRFNNTWSIESDEEIVVKEIDPNSIYEVLGKNPNKPSYPEVNPKRTATRILRRLLET